MPAIEIIPDFRLMIVQLISLIILFLIFKRYGWSPTKKFLEQRQEIVRSQFKEAEVAKEESLELKQKYEQQMNNAREEAQSIIEHSKTQGKEAYDEILSVAQRDASQKLAKASESIEQDVKNAHAKIKEEIIDITINGAQCLIKKEIDAKAHQQFFEDFIAKVGGEHG